MIDREELMRALRSGPPVDQPQERMEHLIVGQREPATATGEWARSVGKDWDPFLGMWVDRHPNRRERRQADRLAHRRVSSYAKADRYVHAPSLPGESQMGVTRRPSSRRLSLVEYLHHRTRDSDAVRLARFGPPRDAADEPTEELEIRPLAKERP